MQCGQVALRVQPAAQLALHDRPVEVVLRVLLPRPDQLHRSARNLFRDQYGLMHIVLLSTPAEAAAQEQLVHLHVGQLHTGRFRRRRQRRVAVLRRDPDLDLVAVDQRCAVHRLHRRMGQERRAVHCLDRLRRTVQRRGDVTLLLAERGLLGIQSLHEEFGDLRAVHLAVAGFVPDDLQLAQRGLRLPPFVGHHGNGVVTHRYHLAHARHRLDPVGIERHQLAAEHRTLRDRCVQHVRKLHVDGIYLLAVELVLGIQSLHALANDLPLARLFHRNVGGHRQLRRIGRHLAVTQRSPARSMGDDAH
jgi:hypothetical protein